jgi:transketolase
MYEAIQRQARARTQGGDGESVVFFVGRENYPLAWVPGVQYQWGKAQVLAEGSEVVLVGCGTLVGKAIEAGTMLAAKGVSATIINNAFVNQVDVATIGPAVQRASGRVVTIEDHQLIGGMGAQLSHALAQAGMAHRMKSLGIPGEFGQSAYQADHLYQKYGMTAAGMVQAAEALLAVQP